MPMDGLRLVVEPTYPKAAELAALGAGAGEDEAVKAEKAKVRNIFWSWRWHCDIYVWNEGGRIEWGKVPRVHSLGMALETLTAADAWGIEQEHNAVQTLGGMIRHRQLKQYLLTGMFVESSRRSGVTYIFRRLRPTVAFKDGRILAALCLHPIAYYSGSWAGAMCPTDDVIAHLALMRGDEHMLWKRSNQHAPYRPEAGL